MIDKQRDQIKTRDRELTQKNSEIENVKGHLTICASIKNRSLV